MARLRARNLQAQYVREYFIPFRMAPDRMAQIHRLLQPTPTTPSNRDFEPVAYSLDVMRWSGQFKSSYHGWFQAAARFGFSQVAGWAVIALLCVSVMLVHAPTREKRLRATAIYCMAATGFTLMALQIFLLLAFQAVYGYVYHQLAILIGMFMAGIAVGSWLALKHVGVRDYGALMTVAGITQLLLALSGPVLLSVVTVLSRGSSVPGTRLTAQLAFPALAILCGMLGGFQFPVATGVYLRENTAQTGLGALYAVDLVGGCAGALLLSTYFIPVFGFWKMAGLSAAVNLVPTLLAVRVGQEAKASQA